MSLRCDSNSNVSSQTTLSFIELQLATTDVIPVKPDRHAAIFYPLKVQSVKNKTTETVMSMIYDQEIS